MLNILISNWLNLFHVNYYFNHHQCMARVRYALLAAIPLVPYLIWGCMQQRLMQESGC